MITYCLVGSAFVLYPTRIRQSLSPTRPVPRLHQQIPPSFKALQVQISDSESSSPLLVLQLAPLLKAIDECSITASTETFRIFHGRGGCYGPDCEHLTLDWFPPVFVLTDFEESTHATAAAANDDDVDDNLFVSLVGNALSQRWDRAVRQHNEKCTDEDTTIIGSTTKSLTWVYQKRRHNNVTTRVMEGVLPDPHVVTEHGNKYFVQTADANDNSNKRQHRGLFLDMANGRRWLQDHAQGKVILNLFSYTCAFSVAGLRGGAKQVVNIDKVQGVMKIGQRNHEINGLTRARFLNHDIFKSWGKLRKLGPYDIIVADPPSYQKGSFIAKKDYGKLIRRLPDLLTAQGQVLLCLNAPELDTTFLKDLVAQEAPQLDFVERLENPATFPSKDSERALKVLLYQKRQD